MIGGLARALIAGGKTDEARALLDSLRRGRGQARRSRPRASAALEVATAPAADVDTSAIEARLAANPDDHEARFELARRAWRPGDRDGAADALLEIIARDRDWNEGAARTRLLQMLEAEGSRIPGLEAQRRRLSALLFT